MRKSIAILCAALLHCSGVAYAQGFGGMFPGPGTAHSAGGGAYSGPGDAVSGADMWWGMRAYNATKATAGASALRICTALDALCTVIHVTSTGGLSAADITTSTCASTCTISKWYDQTGNGYDMDQGTIASRPVFVQNCIGSLPCATFSGSQDNRSVIVYTRAQPFSVSGGVLVNSGHSNYVTYVGASAWDAFTDGANTLGGFASGGIVTQAATDNAWHGAAFVFNGTSSIASVDGTQSSAGNAGTGASSPAQILLGNGFSYWPGKIFESGIWPVAFSTGDMNALSSNQHAYGIY